MSVDIREQVVNLVNSLTNLSPSRNIISQLILMLPKRLPDVEVSYPEISSSSEAKAFVEGIGIKFGELVEREEGFAKALFEQIHRIFSWLADEDIRSSLAKLSNIYIDKIPNPYAEWIKGVLEKISVEPQGDKAISLLRMLVQKSQFYSRDEWQRFWEEAPHKIQTNPAKFKEILKLIFDESMEKEIVKRDVQSWASRKHYYSSEYTEYFHHSEYHLDLILYRETLHSSDYDRGYYSFSYQLRFPKLLEEILEEVSR